ncbi:MAG: hypothetical protein J7K73_04220 [Nanoarchaeota archaeon]|nr:hypothetical protein [Nanoarchaeota archaeon]
MGIEVDIREFDSELVAELIEKDVGEPVKISETKGITGNKIDPKAEIIAVTLPQIYCKQCDRYLDEEESRTIDEFGGTAYSCPDCGKAINPYDLDITYLSYSVKKEGDKVILTKKAEKTIPWGTYTTFD